MPRTTIALSICAMFLLLPVHSAYSDILQKEHRNDKLKTEKTFSEALKSEKSKEILNKTNSNIRIKIIIIVIIIYWNSTIDHKEIRDVYYNPTVKDTDGDGLPDSIEINPTNGTQVSNPIGIEGEPPTLSGFEAKPVKAKREFHGIEYDWYKIKISFTVFDSAGLNYAIIEVIGVETKRVYFGDDVDEAVVEVEFDPDEWKSLVTGYDVKITVYDDNGNGGTMKRHIKSVMEVLVEAIVGTLTKIAKVVTELASKAIDWIWGAIKKMLDGAMKPLFEIFEDLSKSLQSRAASVSDAILHAFGGSPTDMVELIKGLLIFLGEHKFILVITTIVVIIGAIITIVGAFAALVPGLALVGQVIKGILSSALASAKEVAIGLIVSFTAGVLIGLITPGIREIAIAGTIIEFILLLVVPILQVVVLLPILTPVTVVNFKILKSDSDYFGLGLSLLGLFLSLIAIATFDTFPIFSLVLNYIGLGITLYGLFTAVTSFGISDLLPFPFSHIDEFIDAGAFGFELTSFFKNVNTFARKWVEI